MGRQRDDNGYSYNEIHNIQEKKIPQEFETSSTVCLQRESTDFYCTG
jgi:hypothetical protein